MSFNQTYSATAWGACAAIANLYGFTSPARLLSSLDGDAPKKWTSYTSEHIDFILAHESIKAEVQNRNIFENADYHHSYRKHVHSQVLKVCKHCLKEGVVHKLEWQMPHETFCRRHSVLLEETCQHIYVDSDWPESVKCKTCSSKLPQKIKMPDYVSFANQFGNEDKEIFYESLKKMAERLIRPFDMIPAEIRWSKVSPKEVHDLFNDAHLLLTYPDAYSIWEEQILKHRKGLVPLGEAATHHHLHTLRELFRSLDVRSDCTVDRIAIQNLLTGYHERPLPIKSLVATKRLAVSSDNNAISFQITGLDVAKLLGVHSLAVTRMVSAGIIPAILPGLQTDKQVFDVREIQEVMFRTFKESNRKEDLFIKISDIPQPIYDLYNLNAEYLVAQAMSGEINSQIHVNTTLEYKNHLKVSVDGIKEILRKAWFDLASQKVSTVAKMLRTSASIIRALVDEGYLKLEEHDGFELVCSDSIRNFVDKYLLINRKATFSHSKTVAQKITDCCGVTPVFQQYMNPKAADFIVFRKSELKPCCLERVPKRFEHFVTSKLELSKRTREYTNFS